MRGSDYAGFREFQQVPPSAHLKEVEEKIAAARNDYNAKCILAAASINANDIRKTVLSNKELINELAKRYDTQRLQGPVTYVFFTESGAIRVELSRKFCLLYSYLDNMPLKEIVGPDIEKAYQEIDTRIGGEIENIEKAHMAVENFYIYGGGS